MAHQNRSYHLFTVGLLTLAGCGGGSSPTGTGSDAGPGACAIGGQQLENGGTLAGYSTSSVAAGDSCSSVAVTIHCTNGVLSPPNAFVSCSVTSDPCVFNGQPVYDGASVTAYQAATVGVGQMCVSESRTCSGGQLSGSYTFDSCTVATAADCPFAGGVIADGGSTTGYSAASVPAGQMCSSVQENVTCNDGVLTPSNAFGKCTVDTSTTPPPTPCAFNGQQIASGSSVTAWLAASVPVGQMCKSQTRSCDNGVLSGSYTFAACTAATAASCTFGGQTLTSGSTATGYSASSVPTGKTCATVAESVTCNNGTLTPNNAFSTCIVTGAAPTLTLTTSPSSIMAGTLPGVTLTWTSTNVTSCIASTSWDNSAFPGGVVPVVGTMTRAVETSGTFSYTLTCTGPAGSVTQTVSVGATDLPASAPLSTNSACTQPGPPYPQTGQPGISFPGGTTTQSGTPAPLGCPTTQIFDGLTEILDQSPHVPRHAVNAAAGTMPAALKSSLPYIPNIYVLARQDAAILFFPNVAGAADYRAYVFDNNVSFTSTTNGVQPRGAVVACAGFRQHGYESAIVNGHHARELLQAIEVPGFVTSGSYTVILEATSSPCPFVGIPSGANATFASDSSTFSNPLATGTYDTGGALAVLRTPATIMAAYGNEIINGQGSPVSWSDRLTQQIGKPVPPGDATLPSDPVVLARSAIALQMPFFDEPTNAPIFDVGDNSLFDNFTAETTFTPSTTQLNPDYSGMQSAEYPYFFTGPSGTLAPTTANAPSATYAFWGMNANPASSKDALTGAATSATAAFSAFQHLGRLYTTLGDLGQDVSGALGFSSMKTLPEPLDDELYVHSMFRINSESTMRRYWWWTLCGGATQAELMDPTTHIPLIRPTFYETSFSGGGNNPSVPTAQPISGKLTADAKAKECLSIALDGSAEYPRSDGGPRSSASIKAQIHPAGYSGGIIALGNANSDNGSVVGDDSGALGFRYRLDSNGKYAGPLVDPFDQLNPLVHYDVFVRSDRLVVFINGRQGFCVDLSGRPLTMKYGLITYGDLMYHSALEYQLTSPQYIGGKYVSSDAQKGSTPDGSADEGSQLYNNVLNAAIVSSRVWDVVAQSGRVPIPPQFSTFDPALCKPPASVTAR